MMQAPPIIEIGFGNQCMTSSELLLFVTKSAKLAVTKGINKFRLYFSGHADKNTGLWKAKKS